MRYNFTHLARLPEKSFVQRVLDTFRPSDSRLESWLARMGAIAFATYSYQGGVFGGTNTGPLYTPAGISIANVKIDFAAIAALRSAAGQAALASADKMEVLGVKAYTWVLAAAIRTTVVEGGTATVDVEDGVNAAGYISNHDLNALGLASSLITTTYSVATAGGKVYTADDTVDLSLDNNSIDVAVAHLFVVSFDLRPQKA